VVLLILAGITIMYVMGDNSIFKLAQEAKDKTDQAIKDEKEYFNDIENTINEYVNGNSGESNPSSKVDVSTITDKVDKNTLAEDSLGNPITIPEGFKVVPDGQDGVEYTYTGDKKPTVQDGIVIADDENNQFVWIPVGSIKNKDNTTTTIQLARYTFDITINPDSYEILGGTGAIKTTKTDGTGLTDELVELNGGGYEYLEEVSTSTTYGNTKAKNIEEFKTKAKTNGGYYLGRYEASKGSDNKVKSQADKDAWVSITQPDAATQAREMYSSSYVESDLINSYSWDTAIVFIQKYSGNSNYANKKSVNTSKLNTGKAGDRVCNIHDMALNCWEWSTEHSTGTNSFGSYPCVVRGGSYDRRSYTTSSRSSDYTTFSDIDISFRPLCYIK